jgi:hypothetical protein
MRFEQGVVEAMCISYSDLWTTQYSKDVELVRSGSPGLMLMAYNNNTKLKAETQESPCFSDPKNGQSRETIFSYSESSVRSMVTFSPDLLRLRELEPSPLPRSLLIALLGVSEPWPLPFWRNISTRSANQYAGRNSWVTYHQGLQELLYLCLLGCIEVFQVDRGRSFRSGARCSFDDQEALECFCKRINTC